MKSTIILIIALLLFSISPEMSAAKEYGQSITLKQKTAVAEILKSPDSYVGKKVLIEGTVVAVCSHRGCWMDIAAKEAFKKIQVKVTDGEMVFPISAKGKGALVEGIVERLNISRDALIRWRKHQAERHGTEFDPQSITSGMTIYRIKGLGAVIKD